MKAAYEKIGNGKKLIWAVADTYREARLIASQRATAKYKEKVPTDYFDTCEAIDAWTKKCGANVVNWEPIRA